jgi:16S rRNA (guanine527-N7)-methyltransferase
MSPDFAMQLEEIPVYLERGLSDQAIAGLSIFGGLLLSARSNVTAVRDPRDIERLHFLDSLSFLGVPAVRVARHILDVGSGGGLPAVVLALALPETTVTALDSVRRKCVFIDEARARLGLRNLEVVCARAEEVGRTEAREGFDVSVARAVAPLAVLAEYMMPMIRVGGAMVAAKTSLPDQERIDGEAALAILGSDHCESVRARSFSGAEDRWLLIARKERPTPTRYPRRVGIPEKRPLSVRDLDQARPGPRGGSTEGDDERGE